MLLSPTEVFLALRRIRKHFSAVYNHLMTPLEKFPLDIRKSLLSVRVVWGQVVWTVHCISTLETITGVTSPEQAARASPD